MPFFKIKIPWLLKFVPFCCTVEWIWSISNGRCGVSGTLNGAFLDYRPRPVKVIFELHMQMKSFQDFFFWSNPDIIYIQDIHDIKKIKNDFNGLCLILYFRSIFNRWPLSFRAFFCPKKGVWTNLFGCLELDKILRTNLYRSICFWATLNFKAFS